MNERIKELMLEAGYAAPEIAIRAQKFAELIIAECIAAHEDDYGADIIGDVLKKHFGVKK